MIPHGLIRDQYERKPAWQVTNRPIDGDRSIKYISIILSVFGRWWVGSKNQYEDSCDEIIYYIRESASRIMRPNLVAIYKHVPCLKRGREGRKETRVQFSKLTNGSSSGTTTNFRFMRRLVKVKMSTMKKNAKKQATQEIWSIWKFTFWRPAFLQQYLHADNEFAG